MRPRYGNNWMKRVGTMYKLFSYFFCSPPYNRMKFTRGRRKIFSIFVGRSLVVLGFFFSLTSSAATSTSCTVHLLMEPHQIYVHTNERMFNTRFEWAFQRSSLWSSRSLVDSFIEFEFRYSCLPTRSCLNLLYYWPVRESTSTLSRNLLFASTRRETEDFNDRIDHEPCGISFKFICISLLISSSPSPIYQRVDENESFVLRHETEHGSTRSCTHSHAMMSDEPREISISLLQFAIHSFNFNLRLLANNSFLRNAISCELQCIKERRKLKTLNFFFFSFPFDDFHFHFFSLVST